MFPQHYQQQLQRVYELARHYSEQYPALAPLLQEQSTDPDVERLFEGFAFLTAEIKQKLEDQLPEIIDALAQLFFPQYLKPIPSGTIMQFAPKANLGEFMDIPAGTELASKPVEGERCIFRTCYDLRVEPVEIEKIETKENEAGRFRIDIHCQLLGTDLTQWQSDSLQFYLGQAWNEAANLFLLLNRYVQNITLSAEDSAPYQLDSHCLQPVGFDLDKSLLPYPGYADQSHRLIQEYLVFMRKFLILRLSGLSNWSTRGEVDRFTISFNLMDWPKWWMGVSQESFYLHTVPAINLMSASAQPFHRDHRQYQYRIVTTNNRAGNEYIYNVDQVTGYQQSEKKQINYQPLLWYGESLGKPTFYLLHKPAISGRGHDLYIDFVYDDQRYPVDETISVNVTCCQGRLPEYLGRYDIDQPTDTSPENVSYYNLHIPSFHHLPVVDSELLWRFQSLLSMNFMSIANKQTLYALFQNYMNTGVAHRQAQKHRIDGIEAVHCQRATRLYQGSVLAGYEVKIDIKPEYFPSEGDMYLFGCLMERFFALTVPANHFSVFSMEIITTGELWNWPIRFNEINSV